MLFAVACCSLSLAVRCRLLSLSLDVRCCLLIAVACLLKHRSTINYSFFPLTLVCSLLQNQHRAERSYIIHGSFLSRPCKDCRVKACTQLTHIRISKQSLAGCATLASSAKVEVTKKTRWLFNTSIHCKSRRFGLERVVQHRFRCESRFHALFFGVLRYSGKVCPVGCLEIVRHLCACAGEKVSLHSCLRFRVLMSEAAAQ